MTIHQAYETYRIDLSSRHLEQVPDWGIGPQPGWWLDLSTSLTLLLLSAAAAAAAAAMKGKKNQACTRKITIQYAQSQPTEKL